MWNIPLDPFRGRGESAPVGQGRFIAGSKETIWAFSILLPLHHASYFPVISLIFPVPANFRESTSLNLGTKMS